jgi:type IV pilus assembly protein PilA
VQRQTIRLFHSPTKMRQIHPSGFKGKATVYSLGYVFGVFGQGTEDPPGRFGAFCSREVILNRRDRGFSLLELLIVVAIIVIITLVAIPHVVTTKMTVNETSALKTLQTFNTSCVMYNTLYSTFPKNQSDFAPPANGGPSKTAADLVDSALAPPAGTPASKDGYTFRYTAGTIDPSGVVLSYVLRADPLSIKETGMKRFYTDQTNIIRATSDGTEPSATSPQVH